MAVVPARTTSMCRECKWGTTHGGQMCREGTCNTGWISKHYQQAIIWSKPHYSIGPPPSLTPIDTGEVLRTIYRIAGNFHMVQNFEVFADRLAAVKIRTVKIWLVRYTCMRMVCARAKIKTMKFLLKGWQTITRNFAPAKISHSTVNSLKH